jgi:hypothetical protein
VDSVAGTVTLANGQIHEADLIVAADGIHVSFLGIILSCENKLADYSFELSPASGDYFSKLQKQQRPTQLRIVLLLMSLKSSMIPSVYLLNMLTGYAELS